jgi:hypothetical protein
MSSSLDLLLELGLPGLVFLGLSIWLIRKLMKAARTERDLEEERLQGAFAEELRAAKARAAASRQHPSLVALPPEPAPAPDDPLAGADAHAANPAHLVLVAAIARQQSAHVLWVRSNAEHVAWCERRHAAAGGLRQVICVGRIEGGSITDQWFFG